jgi:hypothetical protein
MLTMKSICPPAYATTVGTRALGALSFASGLVDCALKKTSKKKAEGSVRLLVRHEKSALGMPIDIRYNIWALGKWFRICWEYPYGTDADRKCKPNRGEF